MTGEQIQKKHGTSYYLATLLFPRDIREATFKFYGFVRLADDLVDLADSPAKAKADIENWIAKWKETVTTGQTSNKIMADMFAIAKAYQIPLEFINAFNQSMYTDTHKETYATYQELQEYMYGSAEIIGEVMARIIGFKGDALPHARALGEAMQMINFLRDVEEDYQIRKRIYLPKEDMDKFGVTTEMIAQSTKNANMRNLILFECDRTKEILKYAKKGIPMLSISGQKAVLAATHIYEKVLENIIESDGDISAHVEISKLHKLYIISKILPVPANKLSAIL